MNDSEPIIALKRVKSDLFHIRATLDGGGTTVVAVPQVRQKWQRIAATLDQLEWTSLEALDESGSVLALIRAEPVVEPETVEAIEIDPTTRLGELVGAQDMVLVRFEEMARQTFEAQNRVIEMLSQQIESMNENYSEAIASAHQYAIQSADAQAQLLPPQDETKEDPIVKTAVNAAVQGAMKNFMGAPDAPKS